LEENTLVGRVSLYLRQTSHKRAAWPVHRLDRGVSGLLVLAKSPAALTHLQEQFKRRKPSRRYIGIVAGHVRQTTGTFESYLETGKNLDQFRTFEEGKGRLAITHYVVQKYLPGATVVEVQLETGRRNQIRVHFADAGHPVLGDPRYKPQEATHGKWQNNRLALHAVSLGFEHPVTGKPLAFESRLPNAMLRFIGKE
jgi:23S rRNA pseudouridine1911/1915/1917 synthase